MSPERRRIAVQHARDKGLSERHACQLVSQPRGTQRYQPTQRNDEDQLTQAIIALASQYGRYGVPPHHAVAAGSRLEGWQRPGANIWRREGLKVPAKQKPRGRLWLNDGSCIRLPRSLEEAKPIRKTGICSVLVQNLDDATLLFEAASIELKSISDGIRSGLPLRDQTPRIQKAFRELAVARDEKERAHDRLDDYLSRGIAPEDPPER